MAYRIALLLALPGSDALAGGDPLPVFDQRILQEGGAPAESLAHGDLDGDGDIDVVAGLSNDTLVWYENLGGSDPEFSSQVVYTGSSEVEALLLTDLDSDGDLDIVGAPRIGTIYWLENDGNARPTFTFELLSTTAGGDSLAACDIDGNGTRDVICGGGDLFWISNDGAPDPSFVTTTISFLSADAVSCGDLDGDGDQDIIFETGFSTNSSLRWAENSGGPAPTFTMQQLLSFSDFLAGPAFSAIADMDGDSDLDIVLDLENLSGGDDRIVQLVNNGEATPTFLAVELFASRSISSSLAVSDVDGDGLHDIVGAISNPGGPDELVWLKNLGQVPPVFLKATVSQSLEVPIFPLAADLNQDGHTDLLGAAYGRYPNYERAIAWFPNAQITNLTSGQQYRRLTDAISAASQGDMLDAYPVHMVAEPDISLQDKALAIAFRKGDVITPGGGSLLLSSGAQLVSSAGADWEVNSAISLPASSAAALSGESIRMNARSILSIADLATLELQAPLGTELRGTINLAQGAELSVMGDLTLGGAPSFDQQVVSEGASELSDLVTTDLDADGFPDLVAVAPGDSSLTWYRNSGISPSSFVAVSTGLTLSDMQSIASGDVDHDGDMDLIISGAELWWLENDGAPSPTFTSYSISAADNFHTSLLTTDLDTDGDRDIVSTSNFGTVRWYESDGMQPPSFVMHEIPSASFFWDCAVSDLDGDGDVDIAAAGPLGDGGTTIVWFENMGGSPPMFVSHTFSQPALGAPAIKIADLDGDGDQDMLSVLRFGNTILWFENELATSEQFIQRVLTDEAFDQIVDLAVGDIDLDGDIDIAYATEAQETIAWLANNGAPNPQFSKAVISEFSSLGATIVLEDLDLDGDPELAAAMSSGRLAWFENTLTHEYQLAEPGSAIAASDNLSIRNTTAVVDTLNGLQALAAIEIERTSTLTGTGSILASVVTNGGLIDIKPGATLSINGSLMSEVVDPILGVVAGNVLFEFDGMCELPNLSINGSAMLGGGLRVQGPLEQCAEVGEQFDVLTASSILDRFDVALFPGFPDSRFMRLQYNTGGTASAIDGSVTRGVVESVTIIVDSLSGNVDIGSGLDFTTGGAPTAAAVGDLDGDGDLDLVVTIPDSTLPEVNPGSIVILFNGGTTGGVWNGFASSTQVAVGINPTGVSVGVFDDVNGIDIAVANNGDNTAHILLNQGGGAFSPASPGEIFTAGVNPVDVAAVDLDNDGFDDIAVTTHDGLGNGLLSARLNQGVSAGWDGLGGEQNFQLLTDPTDVDPGDFDNDKDVDVDLAVANPFDGYVSVLINLGVNASVWQGFATRIDIRVGESPERVDIADLDLDGFNDIVSSNSGDGTVSIVLSEGDQNNDTTWDGGFIPSVELPVGDNARSIAAADLDEDGDADLAIVADDEMGEPTVQVLRNDLTNGQLAFAPAQDVQTGAAPTLVLAGDVDDDGADDLITVNQDTGGTQAQAPASTADSLRQISRPRIGHHHPASPLSGPTLSNDVSVALNLFAPDCPGDASGDGSVDITDLNQVLGNFQQIGAPGIPGDLNESGTVDIVDLNLVLGNFGLSC